ncbi:hypothetical protein [Bilophila wadsworthia]|uniref:hypothetical protein n=1 Tax=Bilophila wadsworthia TaxID=35833 RepID=UPI003AF0C9B2
MDGYAGKGHQVLLIDDDSEFCELMTDYLDVHSFAVSSVHTGTAARYRSRTDGGEGVLRAHGDGGDRGRQTSGIRRHPAGHAAAGHFGD